MAMHNNNTILTVNNNILITTTAILLLKYRFKKKRRWWVRPIFQKRYCQGDYHNLLQEMRFKDREMFFVYTRMSVEAYDYLLSLIGPRIKKKSNRPNISESCRLAITLRLLASGDSLQSISFAFRIGKSTICNIFKETCEELWNVLQPIYLKSMEKASWELIAKEFDKKWQLPNCVGAIDGKHIAIKAPNKSGSLYYNYKKNYSIILFAVCDANYRFTYVDVGSYGSQSDGGVLRESTFGHLLNNGGLNIPNDRILPGTNKPVPCFFVADEAFPLQMHLLRPYSGRNLVQESQIFNYRLSRARRIIENTFGIYAARWRIFHKTIHAYPENVTNIVKATVCLHNYIKNYEESNMEPTERKYISENSVDRVLASGECLPGDWRNEVSDSGALKSVRSLKRRVGTRNATNDAVQFRNYMKNYLCDIYPVDWQIDHVTRTK